MVVQKTVKWTKKRDALLGTMRDSDLGLELGISRAMVQKRRVELNIPSWRHATGNFQRVDRLLANHADSEIAQRCGVSAARVYRRRVELSERRGEWIQAPRATYTRHTLEQAREAAVVHGGECLSAKYSEMLRWRCAKGHIFKKGGHTVIARRQWCGVCRGWPKKKKLG